jgi:hypothetical protein
MSHTSKDQVDLIEDITVEELLADGLVEDVEVSGEEQGKKKLDDEKEGTADAPVANAVPTDAPAADAVQPAADAVASAVSAAPVAVAPHSLGQPESPALAPEVQKAVAATDSAIAAAPVAQAPQTKAGLINAMYQHMSTMKTEDLANVYSTLTTPQETPKAEEPKAGSEDDSEAEKADEKGEDEQQPEAEKSAEGEDDKEKEDKKEDDVKENLDVLLQAETSLSEAFRSKASELFESTVKAKLAEEVTRIEENYRSQLDEETTKIASSLSEKVDSYLSYVVGTWMEENKVAIESGLRTEIAENFINALKNVFTESYIEVPQGKENLVDTLNKNVASLEEQLMKATESNMKLNESVNALKRNQILAEASVGLASTEAVKLTTLAEGIDFEDAESFSKKVQSVKESYFRKIVKKSKENEVETVLNESGQEIELTPVMAAYSSAITRTLKS